MLVLSFHFKIWPFFLIQETRLYVRKRKRGKGQMLGQMGATYKAPGMIVIKEGKPALYLQ